jgi:hypothetical protein
MQSCDAFGFHASLSRSAVPACDACLCCKGLPRRWNWSCDDGVQLPWVGDAFEWVFAAVVDAEVFGDAGE